MKNFFRSPITIASCGLLLVLSLSGCSKDDDSTEDNLYSNALTTAKIDDLQGIWSVYEVKYEGRNTTVPPNAFECPRDFFVFSSNGSYIEFTFSDSYGCPPEVGMTTFSLNNGIIDLEGTTMQMVITSLNSNEFKFKSQIDYDEDGKPEIFVFTARRYQPPAEIDIYSETFRHELVTPHYDKIRLAWQPYIGYNIFDRYEIYRINSGCDKSNASLIGTINERQRDYFIDEDPPVQEEICYFFRLYTSEGLLAESEPLSVNTDYLQVGMVQMEQPILQGLNVTINWEKYTGYYFSHYAIALRNFESGSGAGYREEVIATIQSQEITTYTSELPYFVDPVYTVYVYDIFGNKTMQSIIGGNSHKVEATRPEILPVNSILSFITDPEKSIMYLYTTNSTSGGSKLLSYNYETHSVETEAAKTPVSYPKFGMKIFISNEGKEIFFPEGSHISVYDAETLEYKYYLSVLEESVYFNDVEYLGNGLWAMADEDHLYICSRETNTFRLLSKEAHFTAHQASGNYEIVQLLNREVLVGHRNEPTSLRYIVENDGMLTGRTNVNLPLKPQWQNGVEFSESLKLLVNFEDRSIWSTTDFSQVNKFDAPLLPTSLSSDGNSVLGSFNHPSGFTDGSTYEKKAQTFDLNTRTVVTYPAKGYPHFVFKDHLGRIMSISSGLVKKDLKSTSPRPDLFMEKLD
ncbi:hypothetical protein [Salinimicrobium gaetbulicola]|uniref:Lipocalin-like protein n=1 Tax=Salinimicrobium gaetbulicola TaxID=999702 RepID=A0ABW3IFV9_9FLAO